MSIKSFRFKQFVIHQDKTAMKVGTDGVLLGAWAEMEQPKYILDIGTGTGLISLMLAQRFTKSRVIAIEIDKEAKEQAQLNFKESPFSKQLDLFHLPIQEYSLAIKFDLIVSNPPFFQDDERTSKSARKNARQQSSLSFEDLLEKTSELLSENGYAAFIIPYAEEENFISIAEKKGLFLTRLTRVKGNVLAEIKRSLVQFSFQKSENIQKNLLIIEESRHLYTKEYVALTQSFYLKM